jgi:prolyl oligopeptidase
VPVVRNGKWFYLKNDGLSNQPTLYVQTGSDGEARALINPNSLSDRGTVFLSSFSPSPDGKWLIYSTSEDGSDWQVLRIRNVQTGEDLDDMIQWCKFATPVWNQDSTGFYYTRLPQPGTVPHEDIHKLAKVCFHRLETVQDEDELIYQSPEKKQQLIWLRGSNDHKYLILQMSEGASSYNNVFVKNLTDISSVIELHNESDARFFFIGNEGNTFYFQTNQAAPHGRVIAVDVDSPRRDHWREIVPQSDDIIDNVVMAGGKLVVTVSRDVAHHLKIYELDGALKSEVDLPGPGQIIEMQAKADNPDVLFGLEMFFKPLSVYRLNVENGQLDEVFESSINHFSADDYEVTQVFYPSKDGTKIPMYLLHKRGIELHGDNPTVVLGYGGFNRALLPSMLTSRLLWVEQGGIYAIANLRGGSEYGEAWHKAGMLENRQNVFDDFIAAGEWLIEQRYTRREKLAISGRSNGGLLVSACMNQRPDLFGAVICGVPVTDMLRYQHFTVGRFWVPEYGDAEANAEHFDFMYKYSPLHNVEAGTTYPPTLVFTAASDDRVVPAHSLKYLATLQAADSGENPIVLRYETHAGHGMGKPVSKVIEEQRDVHAFLVKVLSVPSNQ